MTIAELRELARHAAHRTAPAEFSVGSVDAALADEFKKMTGSVNNFMRNKYDIFDIIIENADEIVPVKVMDAMGQFAEVIQIANGDQKVFKRGPLGRNRAKKFLTQVGLNGLYETFRLDHETFTIGMKAIGGAVGIDFERMMDGAETLAEFMSVLAEVQEDAIYVEVQAALMAAAESTVMPGANKVAGAYDAAKLQALVSIAKTYGGSATIFASPEFVAAMGPDAIIPPTATLPGVYSPADIAAIAETGRIKMFRGTPIVELKQSFLDETNSQVMIHPQFAYVLPAGKEKIVKVLLEGATQMYDVVNPDQSIEVHTYKKIGVGILAFNNWCVYKNTGIDAANWYSPATLGIGGLGYTPYNAD